MRWHDKLTGEHILVIILVGGGIGLAILTSSVSLIAPKPNNKEQFMANMGVQNNLINLSNIIVGGSIGYLGKSLADKIKDDKEDK